MGLHPEVHKALRIRAAHEDRTISEMAHVLLCNDLGLEVLLTRDPGPAPTAAR